MSQKTTGAGSTTDAVKKVAPKSVKTRGQRPPVANDELWLDFLESEVSQDFKSDLESLSKNSKSDGALLATLKQTRKAVKEADDVLLPESGEFYQNLHDKIMAAIEDEEAPVISPNLYRRRSSWPTAWGALGLTGFLAVITWFSLQSGHVGGPMANEWSNPQASVATQDASGSVFDQNLAMASDAERQGFSDSLMNFDENREMINTVVIEKLENVSPEEAQELLRK